MKKYRTLYLTLIAACLLLAQKSPAENDPPELMPLWVIKSREAAASNYIKTFADAFEDPNVLIGVFELPEMPTDSVPTSTTLSSGEILENCPGYWQAMSWFYQLRQFSCVQSIKGEFSESVVFVIGPPLMRMRRLKGYPPPFVPPRGSRWILALEKTSKESRIALLGDDVEEYEFLNDRTVFGLFRYGHGALCLEWAGKREEPPYLVKVPASTIDDFSNIQQVMPVIQKEKRDHNDEAVLSETRTRLKTDLAKLVLAELLANKPGNAQDPNAP